MTREPKTDAISALIERMHVLAAVVGVPTDKSLVSQARDQLDTLTVSIAWAKKQLPRSGEQYVVASDGIIEQMLDQDSPPVTVRIHKQDGNRLELLFTTHICKTGAP